MWWLYLYDIPLYIKAYKSDVCYLIYFKLIDLYITTKKRFWGRVFKTRP